MAEASTSRKRESNATKGPKTKKVASSGRKCSLTICEGDIVSSDSFVEVKTSLPLSKTKKTVKFQVSWGRQGEASFHKHCWENVLKNTRVRNMKNATLILSEDEKRMIKEANRTAEYHDSDASLAESSKKIAQLIATANHCVAFTGAGVSTTAGIGDYRGKTGKWTEEERSQHGTSSDDAGVDYEQLRPTYTHDALTQLVRTGLLKHIITQNGDGLHILSGIPTGSISELHGNVFIEKCEDCNYQYYRSYYVLDDQASQYYEDSPSNELSKPVHAVQCVQCGLCHRTGRRCEQPGCHGYLKDSIINFGDDLEEHILSTAEREVSQADVVLSMGTTMQVTPACDLVLKAQTPLQLVIVNRQKTGFDHYCNRGDGGKELGVRIFGDCDRVMQHVMKQLVEKEILKQS